MGMRVNLVSRSKTPVHLPGGQGWQVRRLTWGLPGGPQRAWLRLDGADDSMTEIAADWLLNGVTASDERGEPIWWGYVHAVESHAPGVTARLGLGDWANRVAVRYLRQEGGAGGGVPAQTAWVEDAASGRVYGWRERLVLAGACSQAQAEALAAMTLAEHRVPRWQARPEKNDGAWLDIDARGLWDTLGWQYLTSEAGVVQHIPFRQGVQTLGSGSADGKLTQSLVVGAGGWRAESARVCIRKVGTPTDNIVVSLHADASGVPGAVLTSGSLAGSSLAQNLTWTTFVLSPMPVLTGGTTYWLVLTRSGAADAVNHYRIQVDEQLGYSGGVLRLWNGSAWTARSPDADLCFQVSGGQEATAQMHSAVSTCQCIEGVRMSATSGVYTSPYQDGSRTVRQVVERLLAGSALDAQVTREGWLRVAELMDAIEVRVDSHGRLRDSTGAEVALCNLPLGKLARMAGSPPGAAPTRLDRLTWQPETGLEVAEHE
jgi:hypothetical protein